jgi:hypothetical protein
MDIIYFIYRIFVGWLRYVSDKAKIFYVLSSPELDKQPHTSTDNRYSLGQSN